MYLGRAPPKCLVVEVPADTRHVCFRQQFEYRILLLPNCHLLPDSFWWAALASEYWNSPMLCSLNRIFFLLEFIFFAAEGMFCGYRTLQLVNFQVARSVLVSGRCLTATSWVNPNAPLVSVRPCNGRQKRFVPEDEFVSPKSKSWKNNGKLCCWPNHFEEQAFEKALSSCLHAEYLFGVQQSRNSA